MVRSTMKIADIDRIPEITGSYIIKSGDQALYIDFSANIRKSIAYLLNHDQTGLEELRNSQNTLEWQAAKSLFEAMLQAKTAILDEHPTLNQQVRLYADYVYLGIDLRKAPVFKLEAFTTGNLFYLGPFRNRFELMDTLYTMSELEKTPVCDEADQPCSRLKRKKCIAWCLHDENLTEMLLQRFLTPNDDWLKELRQKAERLMDDLDFSEADVLNKQTRLLETYYDNLSFLLCTKQIEGEFTQGSSACTVQHGLLQRAKVDGIEQIFRASQPIQYRDNELLAVDKTEYDERRSIYLRFLQKEPDRIAQWIERGIQTMKSMIQEDKS